MRGPFIIIEGIDGSGKTTVGKLLADSLGYKFFDSLPSPYREHHADFRDKLSRDGFHIYMFSMLKTMSETIAQMRDEGLGIVMSRYYQTTVCYHIARNFHAGKKDFLKMNSDQVGLETPSHAFFLCVDETERLRRLHSRGDLTPEDRETLDPRFRSLLLSEYGKYNFLALDTTSASPTDIANKLMAIVQSATPQPNGNPIKHSNSSNPVGLVVKNL